MLFDGIHTLMSYKNFDWRLDVRQYRTKIAL